ncbi:MAG TPA: sigma-70 family RNA polymerase sigma factor [Candidatus Angelobacter sp.]
MDPQELSPQELLQLCLASEDEALWLEFVRRFQPLIARVIVKRVRRRTIPHPSLVDDLVQETYLKLCANQRKALREFECDHENALFGFLKKVAHNVVEDHFRSSYSQKRGSGREEECLEDITFLTAAGRGPAEESEHNILIGRIARCLDECAQGPTYRRDSAIFWLYYRHGLTAKAISEIPAIGLTLKGVESTLLRLTRMVRGKLNEKGRRSATG